MAQSHPVRTVEARARQGRLGLWCLAGALALGAASAGAQDKASAEPTLAELERSFWVCDYVASTSGTSVGDAVACATATNQFRQRRFNDNFELMLAWWRENKSREHQALAAQAKAHTKLAAVRP